MRAAFLALPVILALTGCSGSSTSQTAAPPGAGSPAQQNATPPTAASGLTADQVAKQLKARRLPLVNIIVFTAATDPNRELGRPGGYTSKVGFTDPHATPDRSAPNGDVAFGGSVEVFTSPSDAAKRVQYIQGVRGSIGILGKEYDYVAGGVVLRLSGALTPSQASRYKQAFAAVVKS